MTEATFIEAIILTTGALGFLALVLGVAACLSALRKWRVHRSEQAYQAELTASRLRVLGVYEPIPAPETTPAPVESGALPASVSPPATPTDDPQWQLPVQAGDPDLVNLIIEPEQGPTRQQQNIQRLIAYLKDEANQPPNGNHGALAQSHLPRHAPD